MTKVSPQYALTTLAGTTTTRGRRLTIAQSSRREMWRSPRGLHAHHHLSFVDRRPRNHHRHCLRQRGQEGGEGQRDVAETLGTPGDAEGPRGLGDGDPVAARHAVGRHPLLVAGQDRDRDRVWPKGDPDRFPERDLPPPTWVSAPSRCGASPGWGAPGRREGGAMADQVRRGPASGRLLPPAPPCRPMRARTNADPEGEGGRGEALPLVGHARSSSVVQAEQLPSPPQPGEGVG